MYHITTTEDTTTTKRFEGRFPMLTVITSRDRGSENRPIKEQEKNYLSNAENSISDIDIKILEIQASTSKYYVYNSIHDERHKTAGAHAKQ